MKRKMRVHPPETDFQSVRNCHRVVSRKAERERILESADVTQMTQKIAQDLRLECLEPRLDTFPSCSHFAFTLTTNCYPVGAKKNRFNRTQIRWFGDMKRNEAAPYFEKAVVRGALN